MDFLDEMRFDIKHTGKESNRDESLVKLINSPAIRAGSLKKSKSKRGCTIILSFYPNEVCDRLKFVPKQQHAGNISDKYNEENVTIGDKLLEYKSISTEKQKFLLPRCLNSLQDMKQIEKSY